MKKLSVVATLYMSAPYLEEFCRRASEAASTLAGDSYEIVLVNDGSPDASLAVAKQLASQDDHLVVVDLSRNFGHHKAMMTGLSHAVGEEVFLLDSDLEEEPEWLLSFDATRRRERADVVFGIQDARRGRALERWSGQIFYKTFRFATGIDQPDNIVTARLMTRRYVDALLRHEEHELNIGGLWILTGFAQVPVLVTKHSTSPTTYSWSKKFGHLVNAVTSFSSRPLIFVFYAGLAVFVSALVFIAHLLFQVVFISRPPDGYTSLIASIWLFSGLTILMMGILGIYVAKIYVEVKARPYTIVREVYHRGGRDHD